ncbi:MAG: hypothetical protein AB1772_08720 [Candidatus Zixiibacteriota bacterium]
MATIPTTINWRALAGVALVTGLAVYNLPGVVTWPALRFPGRIKPDDITTYTARFDALRDTLQFHRVAGYRDDGQHGGGWFLAQYELAPTVLVQGAEQPLVVGNFHSDDSPELHWVRENLRLICDYGKGVSLYSGVSR